MAKKEFEQEPMLEETSGEMMLEETSDDSTMLEESSTDVILEEASDSPTMLEESSATSETLLEETSTSPKTKAVKEDKQKAKETEKKVEDAGKRKAERKARKEAEEAEKKRETAAAKKKAEEEARRKAEAADESKRRAEERKRTEEEKRNKEKLAKLLPFIVIGCVYVFFLILGTFIHGFRISVFSAIPLTAAVIFIATTFVALQDSSNGERFYVLFGVFVSVCIFAIFMWALPFASHNNFTIYGRISASLIPADCMWLWVLCKPKESFWLTLGTLVLLAITFLWFEMKG